MRIKDELIPGADFGLQEERVIIGIFKLILAQGADKDRPFIILDNVRKFYDEVERYCPEQRETIIAILEKFQKPVYRFEIKENEEIPFKDGPLYSFSIENLPLINIKYFKNDLTENEANIFTEQELKNTGRARVTFAPVIMDHYVVSKKE